MLQATKKEAPPKRERHQQKTDKGSTGNWIRHQTNGREGKDIENSCETSRV